MPARHTNYKNNYDRENNRTIFSLPCRDRNRFPFLFPFFSFSSFLILPCFVFVVFFFVCFFFFFFFLKFIYVFISFVLLVELKKKIYEYTKIASSWSVRWSGGRSAYLSVPLFFLPFFSLSLIFTVGLCFLSSFFLVFFFLWLFVCFCLGLVAFCFSFCFFFFDTPVSIGLSKPSLIYTYIRIHLCVLSVYSAGQIFPSFSFLHKFYCTNVQPKVNPCLRHQCDNTRFCSLHKLLSPRLNTYVGRIKREAGSQRKEQDKTTTCG